MYINQAKRLETLGRFAEAEKLLVSAEEHTLAINMYKNAHRYDDVIRLVSLYHKDLLKETYKTLAESLEDEGNLKLAERYYIAGGLWKLAVNMYRILDMWDEAMRVAMEAGGQKAAAQVCFVRARMLKGDAGVNILLKHNFMEYAIQFAMDVGLFNRAEQIASESNNRNLLREVHVRHAEQLERDENYPEAEEEFIKAGDARSAVLMYNDQQDWDNAMRVAEQFCPDAISDVHIAKGNFYESQKDSRRAEQAYIRGKRPDLAIAMYKKAGMLDEAQRLINEFKLYSIQEEQQAASSAAPTDNKTRFSQQLDEFIERGEKDPSYYQKAVKLAQHHSPQRLDEILGYISHKMIEQQKFEQLATIYLELGNIKQAIDVYSQGGMFKEAKELATTKMPAEASNIIQAQLNKFSHDGDWISCLEVAKTESPELLAKYATFQVTELLEANKLREACSIYLDYGVMPFPEHIQTYKTLAQRVFAAEWSEDGQPEVPLLKELLANLVNDLTSSGVEFSTEDIEEFERLSLVAHLFNQFFECKKIKLPLLAAKTATGLLRYSDIIPADKTFYLAGSSAQEAQLPMAHLFFNVFLDVTEAIDQNETYAVENSKFEGTDVPEQLPIPQKHYLPPQMIEDIRTWLLQQISAASDSVNPNQLATRECDSCKNEIYEASLFCSSCKLEHAACIVTGYPVLHSSKVTCKTCSRPANKDDWNKFVVTARKCPWCNSPATPYYA